MNDIDRLVHRIEDIGKSLPDPDVTTTACRVMRERATAFVLLLTRLRDERRDGIRRGSVGSGGISS
ncbi:MAG TPA: hypothetical protein VMS75_00005, partial [Terriglobales bacterium]|nr:hypothetical protein [Terriglobales bacterium]